MINTSNFNKFAGLGPQAQEAANKMYPDLANANPDRAGNFSDPSSATQGTAVSYDPSLEAYLDDALDDSLKVVGGIGGAAGGLTYARLARQRNRKAREKVIREAIERFRTLNKEYLERLSSRVNQGRPAVDSLNAVHRSPEALMGKVLSSKISNLSPKERARLREVLGLPGDEDSRRSKGNASSRLRALPEPANLSARTQGTSSTPKAVPEPANLSARTQGRSINGLRNIPGSSSTIKEVAAKRGLGGAASRVFKGIGRAASKAKNPYVKAALPWIGGFGLGAAGSQALGAKDAGNFLGTTAENLKKFINENPELAYYAAPALLGSGIGGLAGGWKGALGLGIGGLGLGALAKYLQDNPINFG